MMNNLPFVLLIAGPNEGFSNTLSNYVYVNVDNVNRFSEIYYEVKKGLLENSGINNLAIQGIVIDGLNISEKYLLEVFEILEKENIEPYVITKTRIETPLKEE